MITAPVYTPVRIDVRHDEFMEPMPGLKIGSRRSVFGRCYQLRAGVERFGDGGFGIREG